ncbi:MAG: hypothetical protein CBE00_12420 [Planctomycetaceae bacterium TMED240]|nr:hypothetical protein [Rhodopirellula sp.]OUX04430.1 MAG: hypothetical protein CBE00_12420 [Planctomycetaceae bacterium TMED240]
MRGCESCFRSACTCLPASQSVNESDGKSNQVVWIQPLLIGLLVPEKKAAVTSPREGRAPFWGSNDALTLNGSFPKAVERRQRPLIHTKNRTCCPAALKKGTRELLVL